MVHAFFDDSDSFGREGFQCLVGYVSDDSRWDAFNQDWIATLRLTRLERLHTSDYLSAEGEYAALKDTTSYQARVSVVKKFIAIIQKHILCGIAVGIEANIYLDLFKDVKKSHPHKISASIAY
jgi:hypothetical protein